MDGELNDHQHETLIDDAHAQRIAKACVRDLQSFAMVRSKKQQGWWAHCPLEDKDRFEHLIAKTKELI